MLLATKCPHCKTTFKVANDQLKLQAGLVRCGICHEVFNGIEHLAPADASISVVKINPPTAQAAITKFATSPASLSPPSITGAPTQADNPPRTEDTEAFPEMHAERDFDLFDMLEAEAKAKDKPVDQRIEPVLDIESSQIDDTFFPPLSEELSKARSAEEFAQKIQDLLDADLQNEPAATPLPDQAVEEIILIPPGDQTYTGLDATQPAMQLPEAADLDPLLPVVGKGEGEDAEDDDSADAISPSADDEIAQLRFIRQAKTRKQLRWAILAGTLLLSLLLMGQATYQFRNVIADAYPKTRGSLITMCRLLQCQIKLPALQDAISYEADELHNLPHDNTFEFGLLMRNHSSLTQAWPHIELTLKDNKKQAVLRRVFSPAAYLPNPADELTGFPPNQEQPVKLYFVVDKVKATDYTVSIFYP